MPKVERGPKPASVLLWSHDAEGIWCDSPFDGAQVGVIEYFGQRALRGDAEAICWRVNNWDKLCDERDALSAEVERLSAKLEDIERKRAEVIRQMFASCPG